MRRRFNFPKAASAGQNAIVCGSTSTLIAGSVATRSSLTIMNYSDKDVFLTYGAAATAASGFPLSASAVLLEERWNGAVYGITESGSAELRVLDLF